MQLPIYIDGTEEGVLTVERQGAVTVMRADMRDVGRVVRLRLYGDGEGYLGVPAPEGGRLRLTRRLTPLDMRRLPQRPQYAAERPVSTAARPDQMPLEPEKPTPPETARHVVWLGGRPYFF